MPTKFSLVNLHMGGWLEWTVFWTGFKWLRRSSNDEHLEERNRQGQLSFHKHSICFESLITINGSRILHTMQSGQSDCRMAGGGGGGGGWVPVFQTYKESLSWMMSVFSRTFHDFQEICSICFKFSCSSVANPRTIPTLHAVRLGMFYYTGKMYWYSFRE